jgi:hypothetical protein
LPINSTLTLIVQNDFQDSMDALVTLNAREDLPINR